MALSTTVQIATYNSGQPKKKEKEKTKAFDRNVHDTLTSIFLYSTHKT